MIKRAQRIARQNAIERIAQEAKKEQEQLNALSISDKNKIIVRKAIINDKTGEIKVMTGTATSVTTTYFEAEYILKIGAKLKEQRQNKYLTVNAISKIARSYDPADIALTAAYYQYPGGFYHDYFHGEHIF